MGMKVTCTRIQAVFLVFIVLNAIIVPVAAKQIASRPLVAESSTAPLRTIAACPVGTFQAIHGECVMAAPGFISAGGSASIQTPCDTGTYSPAAGLGACVPVDPGYYVPSDDQPHTHQQACPSDHHPNESGTACEAGPYLPILTPTRGGMVPADPPVPAAEASAIHYGASISVVGDHMVVGAPSEAAAMGVAYYHLRNTVNGEWTLKATLINPGGTAGDGLGTAVAISSSTAFVGAPLAGGGKVFIFDLTATPMDGDIAPAATLSDGGGGAIGFGSTIAVTGDRLLVGTTTDNYIHRFKHAAGTTWVDDIEGMAPILNPDTPGSTWTVGSIRDGGPMDPNTFIMGGKTTPECTRRSFTWRGQPTPPSRYPPPTTQQSMQGRL